VRLAREVRPRVRVRSVVLAGLVRAGRALEMRSRALDDPFEEIEALERLWVVTAPKFGRDDPHGDGFVLRRVIERDEAGVGRPLSVRRPGVGVRVPCVPCLARSGHRYHTPARARVLVPCAGSFVRRVAIARNVPRPLARARPAPSERPRRRPPDYYLISGGSARAVPSSAFRGGIAERAAINTVEAALVGAPSPKSRRGVNVTSRWTAVYPNHFRRHQAPKAPKEPAMITQEAGTFGVG